MRFTLVTKAILSITTTCLIGFIVFGFLQYSYIKDEVFHENFLEYQDKLNSIDSILNSYLHEKQYMVIQLAKNIVHYIYDEERIGNELYLLKETGGFNLAYLGVLETGRMLRSNGNHVFPQSGYDPRKRDWFIITKSKNKDTVLGDAWISASNKVPTFGFGSPIYINNQFYGILAADIALRPLNNYIAQAITNNYNNFSIIGIDSQNKIVLSNQEHDVFSTNALSKQLLNINSQNKFVELDNNFVICRINDLTNWNICILADKQIIYDKIKKDIISFSIKFCIFIIILMTVMNIIMRIIIAPLTPIKEAIIDFFDYLHAKTTHIRDIHINTKDEFGEIAKVLHTNIIKSQQNFEKDKAVVQGALNALSQAKEGNFTVTITQIAANSQLNELKQYINDTLQTIAHSFQSITQTLDILKNNDFTHRAMEGNAKGAFLNVLSGINGLGNSLQVMLQTSSNFADSLNEQSSELEQVVTNLTQVSDTQASSLEQTATAVEQITSSMQSVSGRTNEVIGQSEDIKNVIGIIRDIADQCYRHY